MNLQLIWDNLVAYSMQIGLLVGLAAFIPTALRLRLPAGQARLLADSAGRLPAAARRPPVEAGGPHPDHVRPHADRRTRSPAAGCRARAIARRNRPLSARRGHAGPHRVAGHRLLASRTPAPPLAAASPRLLLGCRGRPPCLRRDFESGYLRLLAPRRAPSWKFSRTRRCPCRRPSSATKSSTFGVTTGSSPSWKS